MAQPKKQTFAGFIAPETLLDIVRNTAPFLFDRDVIETTWTYGGPARRFELSQIPYWQIVRNSGHIVSVDKPTPEQWVEYFRLCVAAHFSTVATFVPSDVDTKIRNHLWFDRKLPAEALTAMKDIALSTVSWDIRPVSQRWLPDDHGNVFTGHDGERLSIITAGMLALSKSGDEQGARELENAAVGIVERESTFFLELLETRGRERDLLILAAVITHDAGDIDQGLSAPFERPGVKERIGRLAHEGNDRFGGAYAQASKVYKALLAAEGHRNYPLRALRELRVDPGLLFPSSPFLDAWGERLATRRGWSHRATRRWSSKA